MFFFPNRLKVQLYHVNGEMECCLDSFCTCSVLTLMSCDVSLLPNMAYKYNY